MRYVPESHSCRSTVAIALGNETYISDDQGYFGERAHRMRNCCLNCHHAFISPFTCQIICSFFPLDQSANGLHWSVKIIDPRGPLFALVCRVRLS